MLISTARVATEAPARYAKQLVSHLGRKAGARLLPDGSHELRLSAGIGKVRVEDLTLVMEAYGVDESSLASVQDVLGRHLVRFGQREDLQVRWGAATVTAARAGADTA